MHLEQTFTVDRPPDAVFDYLTDPAHLAEWQTSKTWVEQITPGPPGPGTRIRERTKPKVGREFEQVGAGTRVRFAADGELHGPMRLMAPVLGRLLRREFAGYHERLRRNVETAG
jgi:carbon monoxide dehydrogenase subunit G